MSVLWKMEKKRSLYSKDGFIKEKLKTNSLDKNKNMTNIRNNWKSTLQPTTKISISFLENLKNGAEYALNLDFQNIRTDKTTEREICFFMNNPDRLPREPDTPSIFNRINHRRWGTNKFNFSNGDFIWEGTWWKACLEDRFPCNNEESCIIERNTRIAWVGTPGHTQHPFSCAEDAYECNDLENGFKITLFVYSIIRFILRNGAEDFRYDSRQDKRWKGKRNKNWSNIKSGIIRARNRFMKTGLCFFIRSW